MKRPMRIIQVSPVFPPHIGGLERYVLNISKQFARMGQKVVVYTTNLPKGKNFEITEGVVIHRLPVFFYVFNVPISSFLNIFKEKSDIVHIHIPPPTGVLSSLVLMGKLKKKPVILTYHNDTVGNGLVHRFLAKLYNAVQNGFILKNVTQVTVPSEAYSKKLLARGLGKGKIQVVPSGVDPNQINRSRVHAEIERLRKKYDFENRKLVLFVGALESRKGVEYLIKAIPKVVRELNDVKIVVIGNGTLRDRLMRLAYSLKVSNFISFIGQVTEEELSIFYEAASVFVLPSLYEAFGLVLLEAMVHGKPVITTRIPGVTDLIKDKNNGILVTPRDAKGLANAIKDLLSNNTLASTIGENGRVYAREYDWEQTALKILDIYQSATKNT